MQQGQIAALARPVRPAHWVMLDCGAALVLLVLGVGHAVGHAHPTGVPLWLLAAAGAASALPVAARRYRTAGMFWIALAANTLFIVIGGSGAPAIAVVLTLYTAAVSQPRRGPALAMTAAGFLFAAVSYAGLSGEPLLRQALAELLAADMTGVAAAWAAAVAVSRQRRYAAALAEQLSQRAAAAERLRIAQDLHDVIGHGITLITAQAAVTNYLADVRPEQARAALSMIEETGRITLTEMRRLLEVLRPASTGSGGLPAGDKAASAAAPGLPGLDALTAQVTRAGVRTTLEVRGETGLPETLSLSVYRIVQEALTNVVKHSKAPTCQVLVDITADHVTIEVSDDGRVPPAPLPTGGHGITGMRERAVLLGGELRAGPRAGGGWLVTARLPAGRPATVRDAGKERSA